MADDPRQNLELAALLDSNRVAPLSAGFADRVMQAAETRVPDLPRPRKPASASAWRRGRKWAFGVGIGAMLASAAAATGALEQVGIDLPPMAQVVASLTGNAAADRGGDADLLPRLPDDRADLAGQSALPAIAGPIDSADELETAFTRMDASRDRRTAQRREAVDQRLDTVLERRRAAGLSVPDAAREAELRARLAQARARRDAAFDAQREVRRNELRERLEAGEALTGREVLREGSGLPPPSDAQAVPARRERIEALRDRLAERRAARGGAQSPAAEASEHAGNASAAEAVAPLADPGADAAN